MITMKALKKILRHLACILALGAAILAVFWFNASEASRKTVTVDDDADSDYVEDPEGPGDTVFPDQPSDEGSQVEGSEGSDVGSEGSSVDGSETKPDPEKEAYDRFVASLLTSSSAKDEGYTLPVYRYGKNTLPVLAVKLSDATDALTPALTEQYRMVYRYDKENGAFVGVYGVKKVPALSLYGGLLLANQSSGLSVLSWLGEYACSLRGYYPVYQTDREDRALFWKDDRYYYYDEEIGDFALTEKPEYFGVYYDAPADENDFEAELSPFYDAETMKWGYRDREGTVVIKAQYLRAYPFGDNGIAAVQKNKLDGLLFIDTKGKVVLDSHLKYYKYAGHNAFDWYRAPETLDDSAIGCLRFDHGYMRVTVQTYALSNSTEVLYTKEALVDVDGNQLRLPADYNLVAYNDGVAVLEKNGRYGYYSYEGRWLTDPIYQKAETFVGGLGAAVDANGKYHVFDTEGNEIIPGVFDYVSPLSMGKMLCYKEGEGWMLLALYEREALPEEEENGGQTEETKEDTTLS
ncbi:MAG: WG repeat-containing protein [Ruminococcaceae bacterium]|nr:WG repeat-containing protein [Oscillospiraceae bacterium]